MNSIDQKLDKLTSAIEKLIATPIAPVLPIAPVAPVAPVLPITASNPGDHDLIIELKTTVTTGFAEVKERIQGLTDGTSRQLADHEERLRTVETSATVSKTNRQNEVKESNNRITYWGLAITVVLGLLEVLLRYAK